jgi:hypothetical protein
MNGHVSHMRENLGGELEGKKETTWEIYAWMKLCPCVQRIKHYAMKAYGGVDLYIHIFLTSPLAGGEWSALCPGHFPLGKEPPVPIV